MAQPTPTIIVAQAGKMMRIFKCGICLDEESYGVPVIVNKSVPEEGEGNMACEDCAQRIAGFFLNAEKHEYHYPLNTGPIQPQLEQFLPFLPKGFAERYALRTREYDTPVKQRVYCKQRSHNAEGRMEECGCFIGKRKPRRNNSHEFVAMMCPNCIARDASVVTCSHCTGIIWLPGGMKHCCSSDDSNDEQSAAFKGLVRGKDYQLCPKPTCRKAFQLSEACNALRCPGSCQTDFCRVCGEEAAHDSKHWSIGMPCPRFNHPDDPNPLYDGNDEPDEDWEFDDEGEEMTDVDFEIITQQAVADARANWKDTPMGEEMVKDQEEMEQIADAWFERAGGEMWYTLFNALNRIILVLAATFMERVVWHTHGLYFHPKDLHDLLLLLNNFTIHCDYLLPGFQGDKRLQASRVRDILDRHRFEIIRLKQDVTLRQTEDLELHAIRAAYGMGNQEFPMFADRGDAVLEIMEVNEILRDRDTPGEDHKRHLSESDEAALSFTTLILDSMKLTEGEFNFASTSEKCDIVLAFKASHQESLVHRKAAEESGHLKSLVLKEAIKKYDEFAAVLGSLIPERTLRDHARGWIF